MSTQTERIRMRIEDARRLGLEDDVRFLSGLLTTMITKHLGPGPHPGTGTPQSVHGGGSGTNPLISRNASLLTEARSFGAAVDAAAADLFGEAIVREAIISDALGSLVSDLGGSFHGFEHRVKYEKAIRSKIVRYMSEGKSLEEAVESVRDLNRYTIIFPRESYTESVLAIEERFASEGITPFDSKRKNFWGAGRYNYYDGYNTFWEIDTPSGRAVFEVQFHTPGSLEKKSVAHPIYSTVRDMDDDHPIRPALQVNLRRVWADRSHVPPGWEQLGEIIPEERYLVKSLSDIFRYDGPVSITKHPGPNGSSTHSTGSGQEVHRATEAQVAAKWGGTPIIDDRGAAYVMESGKFHIVADITEHQFAGPDNPMLAAQKTLRDEGYVVSACKVACRNPKIRGAYTKDDAQYLTLDEDGGDTGKGFCSRCEAMWTE